MRYSNAAPADKVYAVIQADGRVGGVVTPFGIIPLVTEDFGTARRFYDFCKQNGCRLVEYRAPIDLTEKFANESLHPYLG